MGKYEFIGLNFDDTDRDLKPGDYVDSLNLIPPKGGVATSAQRENIKGNLMVPNPHLPTGENKCIGTHEDSTNNRLIFFIWNSNNKHGIYQYLYETNKIEKIFEWEGLKFERDKVINGIDSVGDLLYWTDNIGLRQINISRPPDTTNLDERGISLYKTPPTKPPIVERVVDPNFNFNYISDKNFQFAYRYTYKDNEVSVLSPYSKLSPAEILEKPYATGEDNDTPNKILINVLIDTKLIGSIKSIEFFFREDNDSSFYQFKSIKSNISPSIDIPFYNNEIYSVLDDAYAYKSIENIPFKSADLSIFDNRIFVPKNEQGFEVDESLITFNVNIKTKKLFEGDKHPIPGYGRVRNPRRVRDGDGNPSGRPVRGEDPIPITDKTTKFFKNGGLYNISLSFYDEYGRNSTSTNLKSLTIPLIPFVEVERLYSLDLSKRHYIEASVSGSPPSWAKSFQILLSREQFYSQYAQYPANLMFYVRPEDAPATGDGEPAVFDWEYVHNGNVYLKHRPTSINRLEFSYIHLQTPINAPFVPDRECFVRILSDDIEVIEPVIDVIGDKIVVNNFDVFDGDFGSWRPNIMIEVFKINKIKEDVVFEIGESFDLIENPDGSKSFPSSPIEIFGDTYTIDTVFEPIIFKYDVSKELMQQLLNENYDGNNLDTIFHPFDSIKCRYESPSPHFSGIIDTTNTEGSSSPNNINLNNNAAFNARQGARTTIGRVTALNQKKTFTLDYSKIASDIGRVNIINIENSISTNPSTIVFSDTYIQNTLINGLSSFDALSEYNLSIEGGHIKKIIPLENVLLVIQERETTSLYINEGFINTGDGQQFLSKTANVIGDDRKLQGGYGTINPESVVQHNGKVYYFDMNKGEVLRYAENGLTPLAATYKAKSYFTKKSRERLKYKDQAKVYGVYHPYLDMYILTFASVGEYPAETIAFSEKDKRWITRFSFAPEMYGKINTELVSFYKGNLWVHERNEVRNSFYGTSNNSEIAFVANEHPDYEKKFDNITLDSSEPCDVEMSNSKGQVTDLIASEGEFKELGGNWYANILRDKNTPQIELGSNETPLHHGDEMISNTLKVKIKNNNNLPVTINNVKIGYKATSGQHLNEK